MASLLPELTEEQRTVLKTAVLGHNLIILGQCGTGKTHVLRHIIKKLKEVKDVAVTSTTGIASIQLGFDSTTLHHWSGIIDGRFSEQKLVELFEGDDRFQSAKGRIWKADCLVIDEIGMLSAKTFNMVEFVCRHVRKNNHPFGGLQIIACGDFKQLPPVPNYRFKDDGSHCFESTKFDATFPHCIILKQVVRQDELDLIRTVNQLCDGLPSQETIQFLQNQKDPLPDDMDVVQLYGTNFDTSFVNHQKLDEMEGKEFVCKATDKGRSSLLKREHTAPKVLVLKEGAPVILTRNICGGLYNGTRGKVHRLNANEPPVINFDGKLVPLEKTPFEIFDPEQNKCLASRTQYPIILAFALTVHRAQGQTLNYVQMDCSSFFSPGQMGVAVGRVKKKKNLRILNFNHKAAHLKHKDSVYKFYEGVSANLMLLEDLSCCQDIQIQELPTSVSPLNDNSEMPEPTIVEILPTQPTPDLVSEKLDCPYDVQDFIKINANTSFISSLPENKIPSENFTEYLNFLYTKVFAIYSATDRKKHSQWADAYSQLNRFMLSDNHLQQGCRFFEVQTMTKNQNKLSTKLIFWLMEKEIEKKSKEIVHQQQQKINISQQAESPKLTELHSVQKSKIRYIAGCCVFKVKKKLCESVMRNLGKSDCNSKTIRNVQYRKQQMLAQFRINEDEVLPVDEDSMLEIKFKQGQSRGLFVVNDSVFEFFLQLDSLVQRHLTPESFHLYHDNLHIYIRNVVDNDDPIFEQWIDLFGSIEAENIEDEIFLTFILELFRDVTEFYLKISLADGLKKFKELVPRKKKQAIRTKVTALGEKGVKRPHETASSSSSETQPNTSTDPYICRVCKSLCEDSPNILEEQSIGCDKCDNWYHYKCVHIQGNESFLTSKRMKWYCIFCSKKGKGKGKSKKK